MMCAAACRGMTYTEYVAAYCSDSWSEEAAKALQRRRPRLQAIDGGMMRRGLGLAFEPDW